ncbi:MAG: HD domain-containing phosphohydrolase [Pseudomonadota bacterium]
MSHEKISSETVISILRTTDELHNLKDVDAVIDHLLHESRKLTNSEAGSVFLMEGNELVFSYVHNDVLFQKNDSSAAIYEDIKIPVNKNSIVGYSAITGEILSIDDVYNISNAVPYKFNDAFDKKSGYVTKSVLTIPLKTMQENLVGIMQLINTKDKSGNIVNFSEEDKLYVPLLASYATVAIERGKMNRELILRMMKLAELRDPLETGGHVQRVGAYSSEIYQHYAVKKGIDKKEMKNTRDLIRLAAMLHDVGKVGISDTILKKPAKLDEDEFNQMKLHTIYGAQVFVNKTASPIDDMAREIALHHHQKFDGTGYPGVVNNLSELQIFNDKCLKGEDIPLPARIVALADVFDALSSARYYKPPWPDDKIIKVIKENSGTQFDPEMVDSFLDIFDVMVAIRNKYKDDIMPMLSRK